MSDYPGKQNLERRIISIKTVRRGINWLRKNLALKKSSLNKIKLCTFHLFYTL